MKYVLVICLALSSCTLPCPAQTWEEMVQQQIEHHRELELEEKRIEVLKRLQPDQNIFINNTSSSNSSTKSSNQNEVTNVL